MLVDELGIEIHKIMALGIDGHSGVTGYKLPEGGYLPFLLEPDRERVTAFKSDRSAFLIDGFPFVTQIDGRDKRDEERYAPRHPERRREREHARSRPWCDVPSASHRINGILPVRRPSIRWPRSARTPSSSPYRSTTSADPTTFWLKG